MTRFTRRSFLLTLPVALVAAGVAGAGLFMPDVPDDLDLSLNRTTEAALYHAELMPDAAPIQTGGLHVWSVSLTTAEGAPVTAAKIAVSGGMPQHGHGLPTAPQVTQDLGDGRYVIEGVKFNMRGWWTFTLDIDGQAGRDAVTFNLVL